MKISSILGTLEEESNIRLMLFKNEIPDTNNRNALSIKLC